MMVAPSIQVEVLPDQEVSPGKKTEAKISKTIGIETEEAPAREVLSARPAYGSFEPAMLENNRMKSSSRLIDTLISLAVNACLLIVPIFAGLYFTDTLDLKQFATTFLIAPPPPPPPPPAATPVIKATVPPHRVFENSGRLVAPTAIPKQIAQLKEEPLPDMQGSSGVVGGVPGGVTGGSMGGVIGGVIGGTTMPAAPMAPKEKGPRAPVRVGGHVKEPLQITRVEPKYPTLAIQTHLQGVVIVQAIIDEEGNVTEVKAVSGPPLLIDSALNAVRKWKYQPTYLNDQPVAVELNVTVEFRLAG